MIATVVYFSIQKQKLNAAVEKEIAVKLTEENERIRFAKDIHDELGSGLSKISFLSEIIVQQNKPQQESKLTATAISETAKGLINNMRDLIWALNPENITFNTLLANIREYASDYLEDFPTELIIIFPEQIENVNISRECHREIMMTIKESLNNIVKHANAETVVIKADITGAEFWVSVSDNGCGIAAEHSSSGHGMKNMKSRMVVVGGVFECESSTHAGTTITVKIPVAKMAVE
jgi:signal transduction histidine kinase